MSVLRRRSLWLLLVGLALSGSLIALAAPGAAGNTAPAPKVLEKTPALAAIRAPRIEPPLAGFEPLAQRLDGAQLWSDLPGGRRAELTLDPGLQSQVTATYRKYAVPYGAFVALEPASGKVLAYVSHSSANPAAGDLVRDASAPSASVFKLVTAAALLEAGVTPDTRVCYGGGGFRRLTARDIADNPHDRVCATLAEAIAGSINAVIAKLADHNLDRAGLERAANAFGYGRALEFDAKVMPSPLEIPEDRLERARTAAGFWHTGLSPLHAAVLAATIANGGDMPRPSMVRRVLDANGAELTLPEPRAARGVLSKATAKSIGTMMLGTVTTGTARSAFHDAHGRPFLPGVAIAGKTGSLSSDNPYRAYSWWVGYAPEAAPTIALAALVVNTPEWRIKASQVAREALQYWLVTRNRPAPHTRAAAAAPAATSSASQAPAAPSAPAVAPAAPALATGAAANAPATPAAPATPTPAAPSPR